MAIKATGQITIVDLSDNRQLSVYLTANLPKTQILDQNTGSTTYGRMRIKTKEPLESERGE